MSNLNQADGNAKPVRPVNNNSKPIAEQEESQDKQKHFSCVPICCSIPTDRKRTDRKRIEKHNDEEQYQPKNKKRIDKRNDEEQYQPKNKKRIEKRYDEEQYQPKNSTQTYEIVTIERNIPNSSKPNKRNEKFHDTQKTEDVHTGKQIKEPSENASKKSGPCFVCCSIPADNPKINKKRIEKANLDQEYEPKKEKRTPPSIKSRRNMPNRSNPYSEDEEFKDKQKQSKSNTEKRTNSDKDMTKNDTGSYCSPHCCSIPTDYKPTERTERSNKYETDSLSYTSAESDSGKPSNSKHRGKRTYNRQFQ